MPCLANASRTSRSPLPCGTRRTVRRCERGLPEDGRVRADVLSLEEAVRRHGHAVIRRLKQLEENSKLKRLVANLTLARGSSPPVRGVNQD